MSKHTDTRSSDFSPWGVKWNRPDQLTLMVLDFILQEDESSLVWNEPTVSTVKHICDEKGRS